MQEKLGEGGLVENSRRLARRLHLAADRIVPVLSAETVGRLGAFAVRGEPVGPLPSHLGAEAGAPGKKPVVERRAAQRPRQIKLPVRPGHGIMQPERFLDAVVQPALIVVEGGKATDIDRPKVHRRLAVHNPLGERAAGSAGAGDAHRIEAGPDEEILQFRRLAQDEIVVGREAFGSIIELAYLRLGKLRHADQRVFHQYLELVPVVRQKRELEIVRNAIHAPRLRLRFEAAHDQPADFLLEVDVAVGVAHDRQVRMDAIDLAGHDVHMLGRVERHRNVAHLADLARPLPGAIDDDLSGDIAPFGAHPRNDAIPGPDAGHPHPFEDRRAAHARALGQRLGQVRRVGLAVAGQPDRADKIVGRHRRP